MICLNIDTQKQTIKTDVSHEWSPIARLDLVLDVL